MHADVFDLLNVFGYPPQTCRGIEGVKIVLPLPLLDVCRSIYL